jgi:hypothetical protein
LVRVVSPAIVHTQPTAERRWCPASLTP